MRIIDENPYRLTLIEPNTGHKMFFGIAAVAFGIGAIGTAISGEVPFVVALIPAAISLGGIAGLRYGGKPDVTVLDREADQLRKVTYPGAFSKPEVNEWRLSEFTSATIDINRVSSRRSYAVVLTRDKGEPVPLGLYERWQRRVEERLERIASFLGIRGGA